MDLLKRIIIYSAVLIFSLSYIDAMQELSKRLDSAIIGIIAIIPVFIMYMWSTYFFKRNGNKLIILVAVSICNLAWIINYLMYVIEGKSYQGEHGELVTQLHIVFLPILFLVFTLSILFIATILVIALRWYHKPTKNVRRLGNL